MARLDNLGDPLPDGYRNWRCDVCEAGCNWEAMTQCRQKWEPNSECGFDRDQPESNHGHFAFIVREAVKRLADAVGE